MLTFETVFIETSINLGQLRDFMKSIDHIDDGALVQINGDRIEVLRPYQAPKTTGGHIHIEGHVTGLSEEDIVARLAKEQKRSVALMDRRNTEPTDQIKVNDLPPRDELGRFKKRK